MIVARERQPRQNRPGNFKVFDAAENQRAKLALSTVPPGRIKLRTQWPCGPLPRVGGALDDSKAQATIRLARVHWIPELQDFPDIWSGSSERGAPRAWQKAKNVQMWLTGHQAWSPGQGSSRPSGHVRQFFSFSLPMSSYLLQCVSKDSAVLRLHGFFIVGSHLNT